MSNVGPASLEKLDFLRRIVCMPIEVTPDMVERGLIAYNNIQAMGVFSDQSMVEGILRAALGAEENSP